MADVFPREGSEIASEAFAIRAETLWPPFLVWSARLIDPMIVLTPELDGPGLGPPSGMLRRSGFDELEGGARGGESGAIIVINDSAGGYKAPRMKLTGSRISCGAGLAEPGSPPNIGTRSSRTESEKLPLLLCAWP